ncbi:AI-2E family transporter [Coleofasciculus sp. FACHB-64]|uniref:AI-2E family transporter n=1 Tax=Cyanophyceae TaxID=3028117 RepID=UPI0016842D87|nr:MULTISPECIES: AI-2E family transporter [unclassified Coleofasciculus]MBD1879324.1 AI-2E family transporter [Coleofasciculus sp. FACHB-T130]MBD1888273.1 AI-2E family transporter [Coleofasciculus sp. FACHB-SPT9]MBD1900168.1 AI-2E family transporter [Coleofasciculus sp. FACHB-125]MBD1944436.1 AI-2E family transporter [Coleofasciculus sp. FACHB-712]MBD2045591.1 AI-2E family transporter [Coleofasciculus sp. FACHB-64]
MNRAFSPLQQFLITWLLVLTSGWVTILALRYVGELISILLTAGLIAFFLNYAVAVLQTFLPRSVAAILVYLIAGLTLVLIGLTVVPPVFNQGRQLVTNLPSLLESGQQQLAAFQAWSAEHNLPFDVRILASELLARVQAQAQAIATRGFGLVLGTFNWFFDLILILVISFYMLIDGERVWRGLTSIFSSKIKDGLTESLQRNLQRFVSGQVLLGVFMATTLSLAFWALHVPFFLVFAVFIGLMEIIPFIGATLGIATVVIVVAFINWFQALQVLAIAIALQQIKDNLVAPRIMGNLTGLSPVIIFVSLLLGAKLGGLLGVILAIPLTGVGKSLAEIVLDPMLPPQTGSFFHNPFAKEVVITTEEQRGIPSN